MNYSIRHMNTSDVTQVQEVARISWQATYSGIIPLEVQDQFLQSAYNDDMMRRRLERSRLYVAEASENIVGFANFSAVREDGKAELFAIYLLPEYQGFGIGSALLQEGIIHSQGIRELYINVERDNGIGRKFYESKHFEAVEELEERVEGYVLNTIRMVLKCGAPHPHTAAD